MWLVIIIALIFLLKSMMASNRAANIGTKTVYVSQCCGTSGDCFKTGRTVAPGVPEPNVPLTCNLSRNPIHCCHIVVHFPVAPPPIKIQTPIATPMPSYPAPARPPIYRAGVNTRFIRNTPCYGGRVFGSSCGAAFECGGRLLNEP